MLRHTISLTLGLGLACLSAKAQTSQTPALSRIVFGSCCHESKPAPIFQSILAYKPQLFIWMGDNIYGDSPNTAVLREKYQLQQFRPSYRQLCDLCPVIGTWDDHDFGANDAGKNYPNRVESQQAFLDFLREPANSKRRTQEGVYTHHLYGPSDQQVRIILLDTRYFRDDIGTNGDILGPTQWTWLEKTLKASKAEINVLISSFQVIPEEHRFEKWANFNDARKRLFALLAKPEMPPVILLSGDRHLAEISQLPAEFTGYPLTEITASALTQSGGGISNEVNRHRLGENYSYNNFGSLNIDWSRTPPVITAAIHNTEGAPVRAVTFNAPARAPQP
ncbi:MAG: alkaline phosphatase D family protein [Akkermansiaceae bacterium]